MAHHKRKKAKNQRAGCLTCKPHKANGQKPAVAMSPAVRRALQETLTQLKDQAMEALRLLSPEPEKKDVAAWSCDLSGGNFNYGDNDECRCARG